jgi:hypothetical protein
MRSRRGGLFGKSVNQYISSPLLREAIGGVDAKQTGWLESGSANAIRHTFIPPPISISPLLPSPNTFL